MKTKILLALLSLILIFNVSVKGQINVKIKKQEFKVSEEGFKEAWKAVKKGNRYFKQKKRGSYVLAYENYQKAYEYNPDNAALCYKIGVCGAILAKKKVSLEMLTNAYEMNNTITRDIPYWLGKTNHLNNKFEEAVEHYTEFKEGLSKKEMKKNSKKIDKLIEECENGKLLSKKPVRVLIDNLGDGVNSIYPDFAPLFVPMDSVLIFTSRRDNTTGKKRNPLSNEYYEDIYYSHYETGHWQPSAKFGKPVNTKYNDACVSLTQNAKEMLIYRGRERFGDMYKTMAKDEFGEWRKPKRITKRINNKKYRETTLTFAHDSSILFFVSDKKDGYGGKDIYYSRFNERSGNWGKAKNLGAVINTPYDEEFVFLSHNDSTLFFSSKGHNTMGGYDIFKTNLLINGQWSEPINIGYPINTAGDDMSFSLSGTKRIAYYTTITDEGIGDYDIYSILFLGKEKNIEQANEDNLIANVYKPMVETALEPPVMVKTLYMTLVKGTVTEFSTNKPLAAFIDIVDLSDNKSTQYKTNPETGAFSVPIPSGKNYSLTATAEGYMFYSENFNVPSETKYNEINKNIQLMPIFDGSKIVLNNVFFDTGKSTLRPESFAELTRLASYFNVYPKLKVEISGHTDNKGSKASNKKLSKNRAQAVVDYLISIGVPSENLSAVGFADEQPRATNKTPEGRQLNRRVEAKVVSHK